MRCWLLASFILLGGCAGPLPTPDPRQVWVDLRLNEPAVGASLLAESLDGQRLDDGRYFQFPPGAHQLRVSYRYELQGGGGLGLRRGWSEPLQFVCYLDLDYADFRAGLPYRLEARHTWGRGEITLYEGDRARVTSDRGICSPF